MKATKKRKNKLHLVEMEKKTDILELPNITLDRRVQNVKGGGMEAIGNDQVEKKKNAIGLHRT